MLIWLDGRTTGTVGGATLERQVIEDGQEALYDRHGKLAEYLLTTDENPESLGLCGGVVEVHIEVLEPQATLTMIGAGHIAQPLARMAGEIGMRVVVVDDRNEFTRQDRFPEADELITVDYDPETEHLDPIRLELSPSSCVVVATWGWDAPTLAQILNAKPGTAYIGLVASPTKARVIFEKLLAGGIPQEALDQVRAPAGFDLGAETPAEIALSILAEILRVQRGRSGLPLVKTRRGSKKT